MNPELATLLEMNDGVLTAAQIREVVPRWVLAHAVRSGHVVRRHPRVYVAAHRLADPTTRHRAALTHAGNRAALSHVSALQVWGVSDVDGPAHVTVRASRSLRSGRHLIVHQRAGFTADPPECVVRDGVRVVRLDAALAQSWPLLPRPARRASLISAVSGGMTTPARIHRAVSAVRALPGRAELRGILDVLAAGCRSELEIRGYESVFSAPGMPRFERQKAMRIGRRTVYLDVYSPVERVNFELDGARWHTSPRDRERDLRRDAALAAAGILVVRLTHPQLQHPDPVRRQILNILASRRAEAP